MRGIIATPFVVQPFQIPLTGPLSDTIPRHTTKACSTAYPDHEDNTNPITGLVIHQSDPKAMPLTPHYSLVRQSCTATNQDWFQTTLPEEDTPIPQWAEDLGQRTVRQIPLVRALRGKDIDSDDEDDEELEQDQDAADEDNMNNDEPLEGAVADGDIQMQDLDDGVRRVHPRRFRLWGLAASPGDGCTAAVVSKYNTQHPSRRDRAEVMFSWHVPAEMDNPDAAASKKSMPPRATTEARVWEWLYGRGEEVPGTTDATDIIPLASSLSTLRDQFKGVLSRMKCVFCDEALKENGPEAVCANAHAFGKLNFTFALYMAAFPPASLLNL